MGLLVGRGGARLIGLGLWLEFICFPPRRHLDLWVGRERATPIQHLGWRGGWVFGPFPDAPLDRAGRSRKWSTRAGRAGHLGGGG